MSLPFPAAHLGSTVSPRLPPKQHIDIQRLRQTPSCLPQMRRLGDILNSHGGRDAGTLAQCLRAFAALAEGLSSGLSTHSELFTDMQLQLQGIPYPFLVFEGTLTHTHMCTHSDINYFYFLNRGLEIQLVAALPEGPGLILGIHMMAQPSITPVSPRESDTLF